MKFLDCTIMIVDDVIENIKVAMGHLQELQAKVIYATSGQQAIQRAEKVFPDLILMDIMMPGMDGFETVRRLKANDLLKHIPVIFLTAKAEAEDLCRGFEIGGVDYITKPVNGAELLSRTKTHLELAMYRNHLEAQVKLRTSEVQRLQSSIVEAMGTLAECRDHETGDHIKRTQHYVKCLCEQLAKNGCYKETITNAYIDLLFDASPLHDIGKVGILDSILLKPGRLTEDEFTQMKKHTVFGEEVISRLIEVNGETEFLIHAKDIAGSHHEKWDGSGYPRGLRGNEIPLSARIMAVADVYDALITKRIYKEAIDHLEAVALMVKGKGIHFDPVLIETFVEIADAFEGIAQTYKD